jgi:DNA-binding response OmpR family regulator
LSASTVRKWENSRHEFQTPEPAHGAPGEGAEPRHAAHQRLNYDTDTETRTIVTHRARLREKLGDQSSIIETVRGVATV